MKITKILDETSCFIIDPANNGYSSLKQGLAWITTIATAILSLGIIHGLSVAWRRLQHVKKNDTHEKISQLFQKLFGSSHPKKGEDSLVKTIDNKTNLAREFEMGDFSKLPMEVFHHIQGFVDYPALNQLTAASAGIADKTALLAINQIQDTIIAANQIENKIKETLGEKISLFGTNESKQELNEIEVRLDTIFFKFNLSKWEGILTDLKAETKDKRVVFNSLSLMEECQQDLLEALAEYNIESYYILNNEPEYRDNLRLHIEKDLPPSQHAVLPPASYWQKHCELKTAFLMQNQFLCSLFKDSNFDKTLDLATRQILEEAKKMSKVTLHIQEFSIEGFKDTNKFPRKVKDSPIDAYFKIRFSGCECDAEKLPPYKTTKGPSLIQFDSLVGEKHKERFIIPTEEGVTFIARLDQPYPALEVRIINIIFESEHLMKYYNKYLNDKIEYNKSLNIETDLRPVEKLYLAKRKEVFQKLEKVYGKKQIEKRMKALVEALLIN